MKNTLLEVFLVDILLSLTGVMSAFTAPLAPRTCICNVTSLFHLWLSRCKEAFWQLRSSHHACLCRVHPPLTYDQWWSKALTVNLCVIKSRIHGRKLRVGQEGWDEDLFAAQPAVEPSNRFVNRRCRHIGSTSKIYCDTAQQQYMHTHIKNNTVRQSILMQSSHFFPPVSPQSKKVHRFSMCDRRAVQGQDCKSHVPTSAHYFPHAQQAP